MNVLCKNFEVTERCLLKTLDTKDSYFIISAWYVIGYTTIHMLTDVAYYNKFWNIVLYNMVVD